MAPACAEGKQASRSPDASCVPSLGALVCCPRSGGSGWGHRQTRAPLMPRLYSQMTCDILFLSAQWELSSRGCGFAQPARPPQAALNPSAPSPFLLLRTYSTPFSIFLCLCCFSFSFFSVTYCSVLAARMLLSLRAHAAGLEEAAWADGSSPRLSSISASLPGTTCLHPRSKVGGSASVAGSVPAAGISPIFSFNRTKGKKTNRTETKCYFHTSLTSLLILSAGHWLRVSFPAAFVPGVGPSRGWAPVRPR